MRAHPEDDIQEPIVRYLRAVLKPPTWFTHIPAGGGGEARGRRIKRLGYIAGTPDLMILDGGRAFFGEVKAGKRPLSNAQKDTIPMIRHTRCPVDIWRSIEDVKASLERWGIPTREAKRSMEGIQRSLDVAQQERLNALAQEFDEEFGFGPDAFPDSGPLVRRKGAR